MERSCSALRATSIFADDWYTMEYMNRQTNGIYDCFSEDLLSEMQNVDVMVMNNEFTYAESGSVEAVPGRHIPFGQIRRM